MTCGYKGEVWDKYCGCYFNFGGFCWIYVSSFEQVASLLVVTNMLIGNRIYMLGEDAELDDEPKEIEEL